MINARGDGGKGDRSEPVGLAKFDCAGVAGGERLIFALGSGIPDRPDCVDYVSRRQPVTSRYLCPTGRAAAKRAAFGDKLRAGRAMNCPIDSAATQQRAIRRVDDDVNAQRRDVGDDDFQPRRAELARSKTQADAGALTATPLSVNSCCSSPAWNISRMMSQPPTNSPLT
jgi:hypothetical protein